MSQPPPPPSPFAADTEIESLRLELEAWKRHAKYQKLVAVEGFVQLFLREFVRDLEAEQPPLSDAEIETETKQRRRELEKGVNREFQIWVWMAKDDNLSYAAADASARAQEEVLDQQDEDDKEDMSIYPPALTSLLNLSAAPLNTQDKGETEDDESSV